MNQFIRDYLAELRRSPIKTGAIGLLLACGLLLWGRLLLKEVPRTASAWDPLALQAEPDKGVSEAARRASNGALELKEPPPLARDLFGLDPNRYRRTSDSNLEISEAKPAAVATEDTLRAAVVSAARQLRVTSVIEGEDPVAMINNRALRRGDTINGFTVLGFQGRSVVLEKDGVKVRLSL
ncbi:MAG: hypothetical protein AAF916_08970 [Planctomycetota bacterium]